MSASETLVVGLGNELISDDGFGPAVVEACRAALAAREGVALESAAVAGFHLLDLIVGHRRVLIVDVVQTGDHPPGTLLRWPLEHASAARTLGGSHQTDLQTTLVLGRSLGYEMPGEITVLVAEALDLETIREELSPALAAAVPRAVSLVREWVETGTMSLETREE